MRKSKSQVSTSHKKCFLCLEHFLVGNEEDCSKYPKYTEQMFKMLLRYLNIESRNMSGDIVIADKVDFCDQCRKLMKEFYDWYRSLEAVRLHLGSCMEKLACVLEVNEGHVNEGDLEGSGFEEDLCDERLFWRLRGQVKRQCRAKLVAKPFVTLKRISISRGGELQDKRSSVEGAGINHDLTNSSCVDTANDNADIMEVANIRDDEAKGSKNSKIYRKSFRSRTLLLRPKRQGHLVTTQRKIKPLKIAIVKKAKAIASKALRVKNITNEKKACKYCKKLMLNDNLKKHYEVYHTFVHFTSSLPPGTTQSQLEKAITDVSSQHMHENGRNCSKCKKTLKHNAERRHIVKMHWDDIMDLICGKFKRNPSAVAKFVHKCGLCERHFKSKSALSAHNSNFHKAAPLLMRQNNDGKLFCEFCKKTFNRRQEVRRHAVNEHPLLIFSKELPPGITQLQLDDAVGITMLKNVDHKSLTCLLCTKVQRQRSEVRPHILRNHFREVIKALSPRKRR